MSSRSRSVEKNPSRPTDRSGKTKSAGRSQSGTNKKAKRERSVPRSSSKAKSSPKKHNRSDVPRSKSKSSVSSEKSKEKGVVVRKKSSTKKVSIQNDPCACGPDFYAKVLGPTADETILVGLETFMKFCQECPEKKEGDLLVDSGTGLSTKESEGSTSDKQSTSTTDTPEKEVLVAEVALEENKPPEEEVPVIAESSGRNVSINESPKKQSSEKPGKYPSPNDIPLAESSRRDIRSKELSTLEETLKQKSEKKLAVTEYDDEKTKVPEEDPPKVLEKIASKTGSSQTGAPSKVDSKSQTASTSSSQTDGPEVRDDVSQTGSNEEVGSSQTSQQSPSDAESQTDNSRLKTGESLSKHSRSNSSHMATFNSTGEGRSLLDSSNPKDSDESCHCCPCSHCMDITSSETTSPTEKSGACSCPSCKRPAPRKSCLKSPKCKCTTSTSPSSNVVEKRQVRVNCVRTPQTVCICPTTVDLDSEESTRNVSSPKGDADEGCFTVRYAITKITKFYSYTTFEVMRSTRKKPKVMPKSLEEVFVLKNCAAKTAPPVVS